MRPRDAGRDRAVVVEPEVPHGDAGPADAARLKLVRTETGALRPGAEEREGGAGILCGW
ncbi:hypothetical protein GCM10009741_61440 [Kribbella lupini]|uniref:Uncharacterized protein n=1 Tax=Kribbella lupini TaxID=291602 RepID=A0ABP4MSJ0_9ACTN